MEEIEKGRVRLDRGMTVGNRVLVVSSDEAPELLKEEFHVEKSWERFNFYIFPDGRVYDDEEYRIPEWVVRVMDSLYAEIEMLQVLVDTGGHVI